MDQISANCEQSSFDLASALSSLDRDALQSMVIKLVNDHPQLMEGLLAPDCTSNDRDYWSPKIDSWRSTGRDCGADAGLEPACLAASEGWQHPALLRKLGNDVLSPVTSADTVDGAARRITLVRVSMLVREGRVEDAARLSGADGLHETYVDLLVGLGLSNEAVAYALLNLQSADSALKFAQRVSSVGEIPLALQVAEHGMNLPGYRYDLAVWTRAIALTAGMRDLAVRAGIVAVRAKVTIDEYTALKSIAEEQWPELRESILSEILGADSGLNDGKADILLSEGLLLETLERAAKRCYDYRLLERVVEACLPEHPEQVIPICKIEAEKVIESKKSDRYHHAIRWLALARDAYKRLGNLDEWLIYKHSLMSLHSRKSALTPGLRAL